MTPTVHLVEERRFDESRAVFVEHDGQWWLGFQSRWLLCDDGRGWVAQVEYVVQHEHGAGKHLACVPPKRVRVGN